MPLHAKDGLELAALDGFHHTVGGLGRHAKLFAGVGDGLVVEGVDVDALAAVDAVDDGVFLDIDGVGGLTAVGFLTVLDGARRQCGGLFLLLLFLFFLFLLVGIGVGGRLGCLAGGVDVLVDAAAEGDGKGLYAAADAKDGYLAVVSQARDEQFGQVAHGVDGVQLGRGLFTSP